MLGGNDRQGPVCLVGAALRPVVTFVGTLAALGTAVLSSGAFIDFAISVQCFWCGDHMFELLRNPQRHLSTSTAEWA